MSEHQHAVVRDDVVVDLTVITPETVEEWRELGFLEQVWPGADLVDLDGVDPAPGIGWTRDGATWAAPAVVEVPEAADGAESEVTP